MHNTPLQNNNNPTPKALCSRYIGRFAPTPSGVMHLGSLVAALASYLDAKAHGGTWLLRIEDIDRTRSRAPFIAQIQHTLDAYQLHWDGDIRLQSQHLADYQSALAQLSPHLYACSCSRSDWHQSALLGELGAIYPRTCREKAPNPTEPSALRLALPDGFASFEDRRLGTCRFHLPIQIGDPILRRKDGEFTYALAVVIDDEIQGITDVVRGMDLLPHTVIQNQIQSALGYARPRYLHIPLVLNEHGDKLSKSQAAPAIHPHEIQHTTQQALRHLGLNPPKSLDTQSALLTWAVQQWACTML